MDLTDILIMLLKAVVVVVLVMAIAGYSVVGERKVASWAQGRLGPNRTTIPLLGSIPVIGRILTRLGIFQLPADGAKFLFKEEPLPGHVNKFYYILAPIISFLPPMIILTVLPYGQFVKDGVMEAVALSQTDVGILFVMAVSSISVYGLILAGWAANSKFPFLGGIRASSQMISYELCIGLSLLPVFMWTGGTLDLFAVVQAQGGVLFGESIGLPKWFIIYQPLSALLYLVALFAETNRLPFDMPESETDLVGGFHTEYGAFKFGLFFVGEYAHMVVGSAIFSIVFLGGWSIPFLPLSAYPEGILGALLSVVVLAAKVIFLLFFFMWVRWTLPRFRYDQVMNLGWKVLMPLAVANLLAYMVIMAIMPGALL